MRESAQLQCSGCQQLFNSWVQLQKHQQSPEHRAQAETLTAHDRVFLKVNGMAWDTEADPRG